MGWSKGSFSSQSRIRKTLFNRLRVLRMERTLVYGPKKRSLPRNHQARVGLGERDPDVREMLIILELDVVPGGMLVGQVGFQDQSLDLVIGDDPLDILGHGPQQGGSQMIGLVRSGVEVAPDPVA